MDSEIIDETKYDGYKLIKLSEVKELCKKYKIRLMKKIFFYNVKMYIHKSLFELTQDIKKYELDNGINGGLYY